MTESKRVFCFADRDIAVKQDIHLLDIQNSKGDSWEPIAAGRFRFITGNIVNMKETTNI